MSNLISSQFARLFKSKIFYLSIIFFIGISLFYSVPGFIYFQDECDYHLNYTHLLFNSFPRQFHALSENSAILDLLDTDFFDWLHNFRLYADEFMKTNTAYYIIIMALLISLLIGREFGNNTIRNKIIAGYSRTKIYVSNLIVVVSAGIIMQIVFMVSLFIPFFILYLKYKAASQGKFNVYLFENTFKENLIIQLLVLLIIVVYCSIFLMLTMLSSSNYKSVLISLLVVILTIIIGESIEQTLYPENFDYFMDSFLYPDFSDPEEDVRGENLSGTERMFNLLADDILTVRQSSYLAESSGTPARTANYIIYDSAIIIISNALGIIIFNRKELK